MAGKAKFDQEAAFKSIIGAGREPETESSERQTAAKGKNKDRVLLLLKKKMKRKIVTGCSGRIFWIGI